MGFVRIVAVLSMLIIGVVPTSSATGSPSGFGTIAFISGATRAIALTSNGLVQRPLIRTRNVSEFAWSPDGRRIAFVSEGQVHVINANGSGLRRLQAKPILRGLAWSPDSRRLAYTGADRGEVHVYVIAATGGKPKVLAPSVPASVLPSWSRAGPIAFTSARTDAARIYSIEADGTRLRTLTRGSADSFPVWSPAGKSLLFQRNECSAGSCGYSIQVMRADGTKRHRVVQTSQYPGSLSVAWSPDGRRIAFVRRHTARRFGHEIVGVDIDGAPRSLTRSIRDASAPAWSPDGRKIAYGSDSSIYVMNADGSGKRLLVDFAGMPAWQPVG